MSISVRELQPRRAAERRKRQRRLQSPTASERRLRAEVIGKFLYVAGEKLLIRGVTYGPFRPDASGSEYHDQSSVERDFAAMEAAGVNVLRTYTVPPAWLLDCALRHGLRVIVGVAWAQHVAFLDSPETRDVIEQTIREAVRACERHSAVLCYAIGNEIPASIVRWYGARRVERFLKRLCDAVREEDPGALVTYVNYPTTEYLRLPFIDLYCHNVYLEQREHLEAYIARLQNLAGERPLILAELGLDSVRNGEDVQAETLEWQVRAAFEGGCAGVCIFSWTDEWFRGGHDIDDWGFGLTDRDRLPKVALHRLGAVFADLPFPGETPWPSVSVVVCTYNGARTLRETCDALARLDYPHLEVIVVSDGSTDASLRILAHYDFQVIPVANGGLSRARNIGMAAATGEIVAYLDDDAYPDVDWLKYLVWPFLWDGYAGVGGPNIPPRDDGNVAAAVANSPGGPNHVLMNDRVAEHIPGCNMAFRRSWLERVGGFDVQFRIAGDDVDLCWRIQEQGGTLGFSPAAVVWHHRRDSIRGYLRQQLNYGRAEAMLAPKWPLKFNTAGHVRWGGRIYGLGLPVAPFLTQRVYGGTWGTAGFRSLYEGRRSALSVLPLMPEWYLLVVLAAITSLASIMEPVLRPAVVVLAAALAIPFWQAVSAARRARLAGSTRARLATRSLIALLYVLQPVWRLRGRLSEGLNPWRLRPRGPSMNSGFGEQVYWSERWAPVEKRLAGVESALHEAGSHTRRGGSFDGWDLEVAGGALGAARLLMAIEEHGAGRQLVRVRRLPRVRPVGVVLIVLGFLLPCAAAAAGAWRAAPWLALPLALLAGRLAAECTRASAWMRSAVERAVEPE